MSRVSFKGFGNGFPFVIPTKAQDDLDYSLWDGTTWYGTNDRSKSSGSLIDVVGPLTEHPFGLNIVQLNEIVWRVKEWKVDYSALSTTRQFNTSGTIVLGGTADYSTADPAYVLYHSTRNFDATPTENEAKICVCNATAIQIAPAPVDVEVTTPTGTGRFSFGVELMIRSGYRRTGLYTWRRGTAGLYYPEISFGIYVDAGNVGGLGTRGTFPKDGWSSGRTYVESAATVSIEIAGTTFSESLYGEYYDNGITITETFGSGNVAITPHKYWTQDGLYDENTGLPV